MYADVSRAYFYAKAVRTAYVKLLEEDQEEGDAGKCGRLRMSMHGTRDAAFNWASEYSETRLAAGFKGERQPPACSGIRRPMCVFSCMVMISWQSEAQSF